MRLRSAEAYNPKTNRWHAVPSMWTPRSNFGIEVIHDRLFVVGGYDGSTTIPNVECYEARANEWTEASDMQIARSALSCCVISRLPNMAEYAVPRDSLPFLQLDNRLVLRYS